MNTIFDHLAQLETEVAVLYKVKRQFLADAIMRLVAGSNIHLIRIQVQPADGNRFRTTIAISDELPENMEDYVGTDDELTHHALEDGTFDIAEHGNEGIKSFLEYGIEWNEWQLAVAEINHHLPNLVTVFDLPIDDHHALHITAGGYWIAKDQPKTEEQPAAE
jgi:hypothetical protein